MSKVIEGGNKSCKNCGGNLVFSPSFQSLVCDKCNSKTNIAVNKEITKHTYNETLDGNDNKTYVIRCESCGANVVMKNNVHSAKCSYCQGSVVLCVDHMKGLKPDGIIPFKFDKTVASEKFKKSIKTKWFLPNKFKKHLPATQITGIYIPSFAFDQTTSSTYNGMLGTNHTTRDSDGRTKTYTTYERIKGSIRLDNKDVFVESGTNITQSQLEAIKPYNTNEVVTYTSEFVMGYSLEYYTDKLEECKKQADALIDGIIRENILKKYSYDFVSYLNVDTLRLDTKFAYVILPTYQVQFEYKNEKYLNLMNGQTGRVSGRVPRSGIKIGFFVSTIVLLILMFILIIVMATV